jgi:hypothetical protein
MNRQLNYIINNQTEVLYFLKAHYPMYHNSNLFIRDIQFGLIRYYQQKGQRLKPCDAEKVARGFMDHLSRSNIARQLDQQTWLLNYSEFQATQVSKTQPAENVQAGKAGQAVS